MGSEIEWKLWKFETSRIIYKHSIGKNQGTWINNRNSQQANHYSSE